MAIEQRRRLRAYGVGLAKFPGAEADEESTGDHVMGAAVHAWVGGYPLRRWGEKWLSGGMMTMRFRRHLTVGDPLILAITSAPETMTLELTAAGEDLGAGPSALEPGASVMSARATWGGGQGHDDEPAYPDPTSFIEARLPRPKCRPVADQLAGRLLGSIEFGFDAARDLAFVQQLESDEPWRSLPVAHPAWIATGVNDLLSRTIEFPLGRWIHAGTTVHSLAPIPSGATIRLIGQIQRLFERARRSFADVAILVRADGRPSMVFITTIVYS
jgi:hypothetical protein